MHINKEIVIPGPGSYNLRNFQDPDKKYMSSSVFVSCTSRWAGDNNNTEVPGPSNNVSSFLFYLTFL